MRRTLKKIILICFFIISVIQISAFATNDDIKTNSKKVDKMDLVVKITGYSTTKYTIEVDTGAMKLDQKGNYGYEHKFNLEYDKSLDLKDRKLRIKIVLPNEEEVYTREYSFEEIGYDFERKAYFFKLDIKTMEMVPIVQVGPMIELIRFALFAIIVTLVGCKIIKKYKNKKIE